VVLFTGCRLENPGTGQAAGLALFLSLTFVPDSLEPTACPLGGSERPRLIVPGALDSASPWSVLPAYTMQCLELEAVP
jgi:hypothetical protein